MTSRRQRPVLRREWREGITLLEIVLALALIAIAMSLMAQLVSMGNRAAQYSRDVSKAQLVCESVMAEIAAGILPAESIPFSERETDPDWLYSIDVGTTASETLSAVRVTVQQNSDSPRAASFSMTQWMSSGTSATDETSTDMTGDAI